MYPFLRLGWQFWIHRKTHYPSLTDVHVSHHICWPWDLDPWIELNNGRTLTLYDLGRVPFAQASGLVDVLRAEKWGLTVAGSTTRYRRRIRAFDRITMRSRLLGWDDRFLYVEQAMWVRGECAGHVLIRSAVVGKSGIVDPALLAERLGHDGTVMALPPWVRAWIDAERVRPWPPMEDLGPPAQRVA